MNPAERPCNRCLDGYVPLPSNAGRDLHYEECPECRGTTRVRVFVYPRPAAWRGPWPPPVVETPAQARSRKRRRELLWPAPTERRAA